MEAWRTYTAAKRGTITLAQHLKLQGKLENCSKQRLIKVSPKRLLNLLHLLLQSLHYLSFLVYYFFNFLILYNLLVGEYISIPTTSIS